MSICRWFSTVKAVKGATSQEFTNIFLCFIAAAGDEITPVLTLLLPRPIPSSTAAIQFKVYLTSMQNKCSLSASGNSGSSQWSSFHNQNPSTYTLHTQWRSSTCQCLLRGLGHFHLQSKNFLLNQMLPFMCPLMLHPFLDPVGSLVSTLLVVGWLVVGGSHFFKICLFWVL